jgi:hypothetical protein
MVTVSQEMYPSHPSEELPKIPINQSIPSGQEDMLRRPRPFWSSLSAYRPVCSAPATFLLDCPKPNPFAAEDG